MKTPCWVSTIFRHSCLLNSVLNLSEFKLLGFTDGTLGRKVTVYKEDFTILPVPNSETWVLKAAWFWLAPFSLLALYPALSFFLSFWRGEGWGGWCNVTWEILVPWPGIETVRSAAEVWSLNQWITREVPSSHFNFCSYNQMVTAAMKLKDAYSLEGKLWPT